MFAFIGTVRKVSDFAIFVKICSRRIYLSLTKRIVPSKDQISKEMKACIRGIIDNDFYFVLNKKTPELGAWFAGTNLVKTLNNCLSILGLNPKITLDNKYYNSSAKKELIRHRIRIWRKNDIKTWFEEIGTNNPKIYKRYLKFIGPSPGGVET